MLNINHPELNYPLMNMVWNNIPAYRDFSRQAFMSAGICIAETSAHDGYQRVPEKIADEMSRLFVYGKLPGDAYVNYGRQRDHYLSMWNNIDDGVNQGSYTMRIVYTAADIADLFRQHYLYSKDEEFLKNKAYPMMRETAEFYRNSPILHKEEDGKYHIFPTNYAETFWGARDVIDDISMVSSLFPTVIHYAEKSGADGDIIPLWREIADNMAPIPTSDMVDALSPRAVDGKRAFAMCREPVFVRGSRGTDYPGTACDEQLRPVMNYDYVTLETPDNELKELCRNTLDGHLVLKQMEAEKSGGKEVEMDDCLRFTVDCARLGQTEYATKHIRYQYGRIADKGEYDSVADDYPDAVENLRGRAVMDLQQWSYLEGISECLFGCCSNGGASEENVIYIAPA